MNDMFSIFSEEKVKRSTGELEEDNLWGIPQGSESFACSASWPNLSPHQPIPVSESVRPRRLHQYHTSGVYLKYQWWTRIRAYIHVKEGGDT